MIFPHASLREGLASAWCPSLGDSGLILRDRCGARRNGRLTNTDTNDYRAAQSSLALYLFDSYADCGNAGSLSLAYPFAMSSWVYNITAAIDGAPVAKIKNGSNNFSGAMQYVASGRLNAYWGGAIRATSTTTVTGVLSWQHLFIQWTGSQAEVWVNGRREASSATTVAPSAASDSIWIGGYDALRYLRGHIDDVRIYTRSLAASEIRLLASRRGIGLKPFRQRRPALLTQFWTNVGGTWKTAKTWINVGGTWRQGSPKIRAGGAWKG